MTAVSPARRLGAASGTKFIPATHVAAQPCTTSIVPTVAVVNAGRETPERTTRGLFFLFFIRVFF